MKPQSTDSPRPKRSEEAAAFAAEIISTERASQKQGYAFDQIKYHQDIQAMCKTVDGPFSTRVPNVSDTALLYATVPDPTRPIEIKTSLKPEQTDAPSIRIRV